MLVDAKGVIVGVESMPEGYGRGLEAWMEGVKGRAEKGGDLGEGGEGKEGKEGGKWEVVRFDEVDGLKGEGRGIVKRRWVFPGFVGE